MAGFDYRASLVKLKALLSVDTKVKQNYGTAGERERGRLSENEYPAQLTMLSGGKE